MWWRGRGKTNFDKCELKQTGFQPVTRKHEKAPWMLQILYTDQDTTTQQYGFRAVLDCPRTEEYDIESDGKHKQAAAYREMRRLGAVTVCKACAFAGMSPNDYIRAKTTACQNLAALLRAEMALDEVQNKYEATYGPRKPDIPPSSHRQTTLTSEDTINLTPLLKESVQSEPADAGEKTVRILVRPIESATESPSSAAHLNDATPA
jgi:hypothetical protein